MDGSPVNKYTKDCKTDEQHAEHQHERYPIAPTECRAGEYKQSLKEKVNSARYDKSTEQKHLNFCQLPECFLVLDDPTLYVYYPDQDEEADGAGVEDGKKACNWNTELKSPGKLQMVKDGDG